MMALAIVMGILLYLAIGMVASRIYYVKCWADDGEDWRSDASGPTLFVMFFWWAAAVIAAVWWIATKVKNFIFAETAGQRTTRLAKEAEAARKQNLVTVFQTDPSLLNVEQQAQAKKAIEELAQERAKQEKELRQLRQMEEMRQRMRGYGGGW